MIPDGWDLCPKSIGKAPIPTTPIPTPAPPDGSALIRFNVRNVTNQDGWDGVSSSLETQKENGNGKKIMIMRKENGLEDEGEEEEGERKIFC